ncbi:MAG: helix-turn-helix domain-containing protein [Chloroflexi bacterium]|nr:helix-turn-helix domain-containing protein [Chloroflexota bacterium]
MLVPEGAYREARADVDLAGYIQCVWYRRIGALEASRPVRVLPDGCIDLLWVGGELRVAGPDRTAWVGQLAAGTELVGLRFRPGTAPPVLGVPASQIVGARLSAVELWGREARKLGEPLEGVTSPAAAATALQQVVRRRLTEASSPDPVVREVVRSFQRAPGLRAERVDVLADRIGIGERQLHRRCCAALGYGPKTLARIVRLQRFLDFARKHESRALAELAAWSGYADQPHLTRESQRLAGMTPVELVTRRAHCRRQTRAGRSADYPRYPPAAGSAK